MTSEFVIKQSVFEGPLDLLLDLIEKRKLLINDVSLAKVTDDFLAYIAKRSEFPIAESASFLVTASTLVLIKSRSLLPTLDLSEEEQENIADLEKRLKFLKRMRDLSRQIQKIYGVNPIFAPEERGLEPVFSPDSSLTLDGIRTGILSVIKSFPKRELLPKAVVEKVLSLEEMIRNLTERIKTNIKMSFREFSGMGRENKVTVIVSFLAMLELVKQGLINARQDSHFTDITIETDKVGIPDYSAA